jgi:hypothetical protein
LGNEAEDNKKQMHLSYFRAITDHMSRLSSKTAAKNTQRLANTKETEFFAYKCSESVIRSKQRRLITAEKLDCLCFSTNEELLLPM